MPTIGGNEYVYKEKEKKGTKDHVLRSSLRRFLWNLEWHISLAK